MFDRTPAVTPDPPRAVHVDLPPVIGDLAAVRHSDNPPYAICRHRRHRDRRGFNVFTVTLWPFGDVSPISRRAAAGIRLHMVLPSAKVTYPGTIFTGGSVARFPAKYHPPPTEFEGNT